MCPPILSCGSYHVLLRWDFVHTRRVRKNVDTVVYCSACNSPPFLSLHAALFLETEEAIREDRAICGSRMKTLSYGELGSVERSFCCCFVCVDSNLGT
jgi:hypothetical protein